MEHHFNVELAEKYGIEEAIILHNLAFWIIKNRVNNKHFHDGFYWTYNSVSAFSELFPYMSRDKIKRHINNLISLGILQTGNYNENKYDHTLWYAIADESIMRIYTIDCAKSPNRVDEIAKSTNTDINTNNKPYNKGEVSPSLEEVQSFANLINMTNEEAEAFFHHYEAVDWMMGRVKIKSWTNALQKWRLRNKRYDAENSKPEPEKRNFNFGD
jgi:hypothetical protein